MFSRTVHLLKAKLMYNCKKINLMQSLLQRFQISGLSNSLIYFLKLIVCVYVLNFPHYFSENTIYSIFNIAWLNFLRCWA